MLDKTIHHRRSIRLRGFDYSSAGAYFVTLCTQDRVCMLQHPILMGIITDIWYALPKRFPTLSLDEFVIMPNHVQFLIWLQVGAALAAAQLPEHPGAGASPAPTSLRPWKIPECTKTNDNPTLGGVVGALKSLVFKTYYDWIQANGLARLAKFWQRNYYEHIVRNESELRRIQLYIQLNPFRWDEDRDNPNNSRKMKPPQTIDDYLEDIFDIQI
jgi:REP element-mobilizing transposase RayT